MTLSAKAPTYSVVVPVYNSGPQLRELVDRVLKTFKTEVKDTCEIILIDDGSRDENTRKLLPELAKMKQVLVIRLTRNFGKAGAVMCGLSHARGQWILTMDDDLQQRPEDIPKLVALRDHDMVTATHTKKQHAPFRLFTSAIKQMFDRGVLGYTVSLSPMKLIQRHVVDGMVAISTNRPFIPALIRQVTDDIVAVETVHEKTVYPQSRYTFATRWKQFSNLFIGNSSFMLQVFAGIGFVVAGLSFLLALAVIARKLLGIPTQTGWSSLMVAILLIGGLNLAAIGITGQYFIRILDITSKKPAFIVRECLGSAPEKKTS